MYVYDMKKKWQRRLFAVLLCIPSLLVHFVKAAFESFIDVSQAAYQCWTKQDVEH
jgi:hypothetical protein